MNSRRLTELNGVRLGFAQNGKCGIKLVHLTPPVKTVNHGQFSEAKWNPREMPLCYAAAPTLVNNFGYSDVPAVLDMISNVCRSSPVAQFSSRFRATRTPLPPVVSKQIIQKYETFRSAGARVAKSYVDALPYWPPLPDPNREATYQRLLGNRQA